MRVSIFVLLKGCKYLSATFLAMAVWDQPSSIIGTKSGQEISVIIQSLFIFSNSWVYALELIVLFVPMTPICLVMEIRGEYLEEPVEKILDVHFY